MKRIIFFLFVFLVHNAWATVQLPRIFGDHMVLQRDQNIVIWGWAAPKEKVTVKFNKQVKSAVTGKDGSWKITLSPETAGGPYELLVNGKNAIVLRDVLVGDVWVCSGQSNMEWSVNVANDAANEKKNAAYPTIRHIKIPNTVASEPQKDFKTGDWKICSPETVGDFTAVGYYFARALTKELNVPIGLINTSWGGTHVETWTSRKAFEENEYFKNMIMKMPHLNLDSVGQQKLKASLNRVETLQGKLPAAANETSTWKNVDYSDADWKTMDVPKLWEQQELGEVDGVVWFRKAITISGKDAGAAATLELAMIDDSDNTYVNGVKVGTTIQQYNAKRVYTIPAGVLVEGKNVIAIRVEDTGGGGGIYGDPAALNVKVGNTTIPLAGKWSYKVESLMMSANVGPNSYPTLLFNAMVNPIIPIGIKGALWYQGEANAGRAFEYRKSFPLMITDWRKQWGQGDFPFYFVQLSTFDADHGNSERGSSWAELREAQTSTLSLPNTGMAVTTDIGNPVDIHPRNKQDVGKRLAALALNRTYGKTMVDGGPMYQSMEVKGNKIVITFKNPGTALVAKDRYGYVKGFEIAGSDKKFHYAKAMIEGNTIVVFQDDVNAPVAVRYGWADDDSECNLFNAEGFPAVPFRTDNWPGITEGGKFTVTD